MVGFGGQILDYILVDGLSLYQAEVKLGLHINYCYVHLNEISQWYERKTFIDALKRHARVAEAFMSDPNKSLLEISRELGLSYSTVLTATTRYLRKPDQSLTLKSKV